MRLLSLQKKKNQKEVEKNLSNLLKMGVFIISLYKTQNNENPYFFRLYIIYWIWSIYQYTNHPKGKQV
jgi:hypothetical protein